MENDRSKNNKRMDLLKKIGLIVAGLFLLYVMIGFWLLPLLLKPKLEEQLSDLLGRTVTIAEMKLNPLVLSTTISTLTVHEMDGEPFAGFETLYANAQFSSIFKWAATVREFRITGPFGVLKLLPENRLNIDDILAKLSAGKAQPEGNEDAGLPRAIIETFQLIDGKAVFEDLTGMESIREELAPISFTVDNLSTLEGRRGEYRLTGQAPSGGRFEVDGKITMNPVRIQGSAAITDTRIAHYWEHLKEIFSFQIVSGSADVSGEYTIEIVDGQLNARLENGTFELHNFKLVEKGKDEVLITVPSLAVKGIGANLQDREVSVASVRTAGGRIHSWLSPEGTFELQRLFLHDLEKLSRTEKAEKPKTEAVATSPWRVALKKMEVKDWGLAFEDRTLVRPAKLTVDTIDMLVENLTNAKDKTATMDLSLRFNQAGKINIKGTAGIVPLQADLNVVTTEIALASFQPYVDEAVNAQIHSGAISSKGLIRYRSEDSQPQIRYEGNLTVDDVKIKDRVQTEYFITLDRLNTSGIGLELGPNQLTVAQVLIDRPGARVTVDEAGVINAVNVFTPVKRETGSAEGTDNLLKRLVDLLLVQFKGPMTMRVDRVELKSFRGDFFDASVSPPYETRVEITDATATGLSSDTSAEADFKFNGRLDGKTGLEGSGQMNPMNALKDSRANVSVKDFALPAVSPYSGKFIGYTIDFGTLNVDLKYKVANDIVDGSNIIVVDQLELGEPVDSPDALNLPIKLGVAILKDNRDRIKLQVPVEGNVKNPHFNIAKTIQSALMGAIKDAGSAPFEAIAEIDGFTGEELRQVTFAFGFSDLQDREIRKLIALADFLKERKTLTLGIVGTADRRMDGAAIMGKSPQPAPSDEDATLEDRGPAEQTADPVVDEKLEMLARRRAEVVSAYLTEQAGIDDRRIHMQPIQINNEPNKENGVVRFSLSAE